MRALTDRMTWYLARLSADNRAATVVEHGLIAALIAAAAIRAMNGFGTQLNTTANAISPADAPGT